MNDAPRKPHTDREYASHLDRIRDALSAMAGQVGGMLSKSMQALLQGDEALAKEVIDADAAVDDLESFVDEQTVVTFARWQPMASDLRMLTLALKIVTDLERVGDLAVNIAERVRHLRDAPLPWGWDLANDMAHIASDMLDDAMAAFLARDAERAQQVIERDDRVDGLYRRFFAEVWQGMENDPSIMTAGIDALSIAKWLERCADHVTNIAEQVIFMARGEDVRHT